MEQTSHSKGTRSNAEIDTLYKNINQQMSRKYRVRRLDDKELFTLIDRATEWMKSDDLYRNFSQKDLIKIQVIKNNIKPGSYQIKCKFCGKEMPLDQKGRVSKHCSRRCAGRAMHTHLDKQFWEIASGYKLYDVYKECGFDLKAVSEKLEASEELISKNLWEIKCPTNSPELLWFREYICTKYGGDPAPPNYTSFSRAFLSRNQMLDFLEDTDYNFQSATEIHSLSRHYIINDARHFGISLRHRGNLIKKFALESEDNLEQVWYCCNKDMEKMRAWMGDVSERYILSLLRRSGIKPARSHGWRAGTALSYLKHKDCRDIYLYVLDFQNSDGKTVASKVGISNDPRARAGSVCRESPFHSYSVVSLVGPYPAWKIAVLEDVLLSHIGIIPIDFKESFAGHSEFYHPCFTNRVMRVIENFNFNLTNIPNYILGGRYAD